MYVWMICRNWADREVELELDRWLADTAKYPFPSFSSFLPSFASFLNGTEHRCNSVLHVKQAQPLLEVRFGEGACPVGRPGMGRWFFDG